MLFLSYPLGDTVLILNAIGRIKLFIIIAKLINKQFMTLFKVKYRIWNWGKMVKMKIINCAVKMTKNLKIIGKNPHLPHFSSPKLIIFINSKDKLYIIKNVKRIFLKFMRKIYKNKLKLSKVNTQKTTQLILAKNL